MDFAHVLRTLLGEFERRQIRYAAIGGFAIGVLGAPGGTFGIDFLVHRDDLGQVHECMTGLGYVRFVETEHASHDRHSARQWGAVDFLHAFRSYALAMLARATPYPILEGATQILVAQPEDVIGLKVQAMANDPVRQTKERFDIETGMELHGARLDWSRIQAYFELFDLGAEARRLTQRFGHVQ